MPIIDAIQIVQPQIQISFRLSTISSVNQIVLSIEEQEKSSKKSIECNARHKMSIRTNDPTGRDSLQNMGRWDFRPFGMP